MRNGKAGVRARLKNVRSFGYLNPSSFFSPHDRPRNQSQGVEAWNMAEEMAD